MGQSPCKTLFSMRQFALRRSRMRTLFPIVLALPHIRAKRLKRVLASFSPTFPAFYLYYPSRRNQPTKLKALIEYFSRRTR